MSTTRPTRSTWTSEDWFSLLNWGMAADVSLHLADAGAGARTPTPGCFPTPGTPAASGSGGHAGPVDLFLALAAAAAVATATSPRATRTTPSGCVRNGRSRWPRSGCATSGTATGSDRPELAPEPPP